MPDPDSHGGRRLALVYCHRDPFVVANRIRLLTRLGAPAVHLIYGGRERLFESFASAVRRLSGVDVEAFCLSGRTPLWKWAHTDLGVLDWYRAVGRLLPFDAAVVLQWDVVVYESIDRAYARVPADGVGLTGLTPLASVVDSWFWLQNETYRREWDELREWVAQRFEVSEEPRVCIGPGYSLSREFLERYAAEDVPNLCHDELRLPLIAHALGFELHDTGFYKSWTDSKEQRFFNADRQSITLATIGEQLSMADGRRVFHPVRYVVPTALRQNPNPALQSLYFDDRDRMMRAASTALGVVLKPGRDVRANWLKIEKHVLKRPRWPHAPRERQTSSWHA